MKIKVTELTQLTLSALKKYGYSDNESAIISRVLLFAQLRGNNQGVVKLIGKGIPRRPEGQAPINIKDTPVSALIDGNATHAIIVMDQLANIAIDKAKKSGIGLVGSFNTSESTGILAYYVDKIARAGFIGLAFSSAPFQTTAPFGSTEARFCTNPLAYGVPTNSDPILFDMTTSAMAYYGLIEAKTAGKDVPENIGFNSEGQPTTNPAEIMGGALRTIAGHKGSGLALLVQVLCGPLVGADSFNSNSHNAGNFVIAIDPSLFTPTDEFKNRVADVATKIKSARKINGVDDILLPGERGTQLQKQNIDNDELEIGDNLLAELQKVAP
ncbi:MAG: Ldh family oxidoreductase [Microgenomates group bacterium]